MKQPRVPSGRKFALSFALNFFSICCANSRLHLADHSDLDIVGKIVSSSLPELSMVDAKFGGTKAKALHGVYCRHRSQSVNDFNHFWS